MNGFKKIFIKEKQGQELIEEAKRLGLSLEDT